MGVGRLFVLALLAPLIYSFAYEAYLFLLSTIDLYFTSSFIYGFLFYVLIYMFILRGNIGFIEHFEHELGHTIVGLVFLRGTKKFIVDPEEGSKVDIHPNSLIYLAPYYFPVFTIPLLIIKPIVFSSLHKIIDFLIGFTLAFHYVSLLREFRLIQTDITKTGVIFSFCVTCILNIIFLVITLCVVFNHYSNILNYFKSSFVRTLQSYKTVFEAWKAM